MDSTAHTPTELTPVQRLSRDLRIAARTLAMLVQAALLLIWWAA